MTFSDSDLQNGFRLVHCLHPDRAVAICVLLDSCEQALLLQNNQRRRHGYRLHTPDEGCLQNSIYLVSEEWEKDQESEAPKKEPFYKPTRTDLIVRYVKALVKESIDRQSHYAAVAITCLLYRYAPHKVSQLSEDRFKSENIRRVKRRMSDLLKVRFAAVDGFHNANGNLPFEKPNARQRSLIEASLSTLAPWTTCPGTSMKQSARLLETYFAATSEKTEWERLHVLFDLECGGLPTLVKEHNSMFSKGNKMRLEDPEKMLGCPKFDDDSDGASDEDGEPPDPSDRFNPPPLTRDEIATIRHSLEKNKRRREKYKQQTLRVVVDGREVATLTPGVSTSMVIPATSSRIDVFGQDEDGELRLAVFPLTSLDGDNKFDHQISVDDDHKIDLSLVLSEDASEYSVWLRYSDVLNSSTHSAASSAPCSKIRILFLAANPILCFKEQLGRGDTEETYLAEDQERKRSVVVKFFESSIEETASTFYETLSRVKHPNVASVFDTGRLSDGRSYAVMESVSGVNLRTRIGPRGMHLPEIVSVTTQLTAALAALHGSAILHCDIKPDNIMLQDRNGEMHVKLCDFGLVNDLERAYTAPELLTGTPVSAQSDIYSLGVTLHEMCTGWMPFSLPYESRPDLPPAVNDVIARALMADPRDRYASAKEMGNAIATAFRETKLPTRKNRWRSLLTLLRDVVEGKSPFEDLIAHEEVRARLLLTCAANQRQEPRLSSDDLCQDVNLRLLEWSRYVTHDRWQEAKERWKDENAFFRWVRTFIREVTLDQYGYVKRRAQTIDKSIEETTPAEQKYYPFLALEAQEVLEEFRYFCRTLPANQRRAIRLWTIGLSYREIAEILGNHKIVCTHARVRQWVNEAIKRFREHEKDINTRKRGS